jgi:plastocyanin
VFEGACSLSTFFGSDRSVTAGDIVKWNVSDYTMSHDFGVENSSEEVDKPKDHNREVEQTYSKLTDSQRKKEDQGRSQLVCWPSTS